MFSSEGTLSAPRTATTPATAVRSTVDGPSEVLNIETSVKSDRVPIVQSLSTEHIRKTMRVNTRARGSRYNASDSNCKG